MIYSANTSSAMGSGWSPVQNLAVELRLSFILFKCFNYEGATIKVKTLKYTTPFFTVFPYM